MKGTSSPRLSPAPAATTTFRSEFSHDSEVLVFATVAVPEGHRRAAVEGTDG
jgi:hypothetical protein